MKKTDLLLAALMVFSCIPTTALMESAPAVKESSSGFYYVEANEATGQARLSASSQDIFIQVDGLYFKDLNKNGSLDAFEDYRQDVTARVSDLLGQMTMEEKAGTLGFGGIGGQAITGAYTVIVEGPQGDACVYFAGQIAYHIERPNQQFREDMANQNMRAVSGATKRYETPKQGGV